MCSSTLHNQLQLNGGVTGGSEGSAWRVNLRPFLSPGDELGTLPATDLLGPWSLESQCLGGVTRFCFGEPDFVMVVWSGEVTSGHFKKSGVSSSSPLALIASMLFFPPWECSTGKWVEADEGLEWMRWFSLHVFCCVKCNGDRAAGCLNLGGDLLRCLPNPSWCPVAEEPPW